VLSCDAKGIRMRPGQLRSRAERLARKAVPKQNGRLSQARSAPPRRMVRASPGAPCSSSALPCCPGCSFGLVTYVLDRGDLKAVVARLRPVVVPRA
jgi:hypothetical protein